MSGAVEMAKQIKVWPIDQLVPYERNARTHSDEQVAKIAASIIEFGFTNPILVDGEKGIIAGHGRLMAAKALKMTEVPVIELTHLTDTQKRAYILADNRLAEDAGWDEHMLAAELAMLDAEGYDLPLTGFSDDEILDLLSDDGESGTDGNCDEDSVPEPPVSPITRNGDVWILGKHRIMCGDSTNETDLDALMKGVKADMVFTDPPYNADYSSRVDKKRRKPWGGIMNDNMTEDAFDNFLIDINSSLWEMTKDGASVYQCIDWKRYPQSSRMFGDAFNQKAMIVWNKNYFGLGTYYRTKHEIIMFGVKGDKLNTWNAAHDEMDVWDIAREIVSNYQHPTQKPVAIPERAIINSSSAGNVVMDLFGGSGSTLMACEKSGRHARLMELDPKYCDVIVKRWQEFTGKKAILESNKKTFDQLSAAEQSIT